MSTPQEAIFPGTSKSLFMSPTPPPASNTVFKVSKDHEETNDANIQNRHSSPFKSAHRNYEDLKDLPALNPLEPSHSRAKPISGKHHNLKHTNHYDPFNYPMPNRSSATSSINTPDEYRSLEDILFGAPIDAEDHNTLENADEPKGLRDEFSDDELPLDEFFPNNSPMDSEHRKQYREQIIGADSENSAIQHRSPVKFNNTSQRAEIRNFFEPTGRPYKGLGNRSRESQSPEVEERPLKKAKTVPTPLLPDSDDEEQHVMGDDGKPTCVKVGVMTANPDVRIVAKLRNVAQDRKPIAYYVCLADKEKLVLEGSSNCGFDAIDFLSRFVSDDPEETKDRIRACLSATDLAPLRDPSKKRNNTRDYEEGDSSEDGSNDYGSPEGSECTNMENEEDFAYKRAEHRRNGRATRNLLPIFRKSKKEQKSRRSSRFDREIKSEDEEDLEDMSEDFTTAESVLLRELSVSVHRYGTKTSGAIAELKHKVRVQRNEIDRLKREVKSNLKYIRSLEATSNVLDSNPGQEDRRKDWPSGIKNPHPPLPDPAQGLQGMPTYRYIKGIRYEVLTGRNTGYLKADMELSKSYTWQGKNWVDVQFLQELRKIHVANEVRERYLTIEKQACREVVTEDGTMMIMSRPRSIMDENGKEWKVEFMRVQVRKDPSEAFR